MADAQWSPGRRAGEAEEFLPVLGLVEPVRQRRLTILFRLLLLIPHFIVLFFLRSRRSSPSCSAGSPPSSWDGCLVTSTAGKALLVLFLVLGLTGSVTTSVTRSSSDETDYGMRA